MASAMSGLLARVEGRLRQLGLTVSLWDAAGTCCIPPRLGWEFCRQVCTGKGLSAETVGALAQKVCLEGKSASATVESGCVALAVPAYQRRRVVGTVVACFPARGVADSEAFARFCGQARLDFQAMSGLCRQAAVNDAEKAPCLCEMLGWLISDEQAKENQREELATLSANLANTYEELSLLYRLTAMTKVTQTASGFMQDVCHELLEVGQLAASAAVLYPRLGQGPAEVVMAGQSPVSVDQIRQIVDTILAPKLRGGAKAVIENQFSDRPVAGGKVRTLIAVPLSNGENCKGILLGMNKAAGEFDTTDLKLIASVSAQAAMFLDNHHLYEDLQDLLMGVLHALTASIDAKDEYTCGHSRRVAIISRRLAQLGGLDAQQAGRLYLAGLLHDIGKIGIPESVLQKPGKLDDREFDIVKRHPVVGASILSGIRQVEDIVPVILHHHERLDGRGYPNGLLADAIPPEAKIVGLADSFDAMTSNRTYRKAMPLEIVTSEIRRCSGTQFDPRLVELLLSLNLESFLAELKETSTGPVATEAAQT
jgi:HD-GYP domain-containing protein (c-di-GMP phosphodiesterase class II)